MAFPAITKNGDGNAQAAFVSACASAGLDLGGLQMESQLALAIANIIAAGNSTGTPTLNRKTITAGDSSYTVLSTDAYLDCNSVSGPITLAFPYSPGNGRMLNVKSISADTNVISCDASFFGPGHKINGVAAIFTFTAGSGTSFTFIYNSTTTDWEIV